MVLYGVGGCQPVYAIIQTGGKQYRVSQGDVIDVERLPGAVAEEIQFDQVLAVGDEAGFRVGRPFVDGAAVRASVVGQVKGPKLVVFKYKRKVNYRRKTGHRQLLTRVRIDQIQG